MKRKKAVTVYDIAQEAGVSVATVSRVLTKKARVNPDKRERIEALIKKYDFIPNKLARGLSETRSKLIGMLTADMRNPYYSQVIVECERCANELGYTLLACNTFAEKKMEYSILDKLYEQQVDAIVQVGGSVDELVTDSDYADRINRISSRIPVIISGRLDGTDCHQILIDQSQAMDLLMKHIISSGHKEIALLGGRSNVRSTVEKRARYKQQLYHYGLEYKEEYIVETDHYDDEGGYKCMQKLFKLNKLPTVLIAINDFAAVGIMRALHEKGIRVPEDISVTSFDNTFISEITIPKLTSISYNYREFGSKIIHAAVDSAEGRSVPLVQKVGTELVIRDSSSL